MLSVQEGHGGTHILIVNRGGVDQLAFSMQVGCGSTYTLIIKEGVQGSIRVQHAGGTQQHSHSNC